jgi:SAM-dependent methyltransferase
MVDEVRSANVDTDRLREQVKQKYAEVALDPARGFHFHTGRSLALMLGYAEEDIDRVPAGIVASFAGTGNPFSMGRLAPGEKVLDLGCGAGFDTLIAAHQVGPEGSVIAVDMTEAMVDKVRRGAAQAGLTNVEVRDGYAELLPAEDGTIDVLISNGVINLCPDKPRVMREISRVLRPGGRVQVGDVVLHRALPQDARDDIDLWSG